MRFTCVYAKHGSLGVRKRLVYKGKQLAMKSPKQLVLRSAGPSRLTTQSLKLRSRTKMTSLGVRKNGDFLGDSNLTRRLSWGILALPSLSVWCCIIFLFIRIIINIYWTNPSPIKCSSIPQFGVVSTKAWITFLLTPRLTSVVNRTIFNYLCELKFPVP